MKINKRIAIPLLSTVLGLAVIGGTSGAIAWYQYNTRVNASFVGSSVADSGVLQIGYKVDDETSTPITWGRDVYETRSTNNNKLIPVTFGATEPDQTLPKNAALPSTAYAYPEAGYGPYEQWQTATVGKEYIQYTIYLRAQQADPTVTDPAAGGMKQVQKDVFLSEILLEGADTAKPEVGKALRLHLDVNNGEKRMLISADGTTVDLYGKLDLDNNGQIDKVGGWDWEKSDADVIYGRNGSKQQSYSINEIKAVRDGDDFDFEDDTERAAKKVCTTPLTGETKITVTVWLEGWQKYGATGSESAIWDPTKTAGTNVHVGMTFDVGRGAFRA